MKASMKKRIIPLLGIAAFTAVVILASCKTDTEETSYTVTFAGTEEAVASQSVTEGGKMIKPEDPVKLRPAGLYTGNVSDRYEFDGWYSGFAKEWDFEKDTVTGDITLTAEWDETSGSVDLAGRTEDNIIAKTIAYANENPGTYYLLLDSDIELTPETNTVNRNLNISSVKLTLIGLDKERQIKLSGTGDGGTLFTIGGSSLAGAAAGVELTVGNNITLVGRTNGQNGATADNNSPLVRVRSNTQFVMLEGSKITGNTSSNMDSHGAAVYVNGGTFTMKGGDITGNAAGATTRDGQHSGGVMVAGESADVTGAFIMEGGTISGNTGKCGDVFVANTAAVTLSGNAIIGKLTLGAISASAFASANVASGWTGNVTTLNLWGSQAQQSRNLGYWIDNLVLKPVEGYALTAADVAKFPLGNLVGSRLTEDTQQPLTDTHEIVAEGADTGKFIAKPADGGE